MLDSSNKKLSLEADEVWFVGDKLETDVSGANGVGLHSVWYNRHGKEASVDTIPNYHFTSWSEFVELFPKETRSTGETG